MTIVFQDKDLPNFPNKLILLKKLNAIVTSDFYLEVAKGNVPGHARDRLIGVSDTIGSSESVISNITGRYPFQTTEKTLEVLSSDANDTLAGSGAQTVKITGLDGNYAEITQTLNMNGTTPVPTTISFLRENEFKVATAGAGGKNAGLITLRVVSAGAEQRLIIAGTNISLDAIFTVPVNKTLFLDSEVTSSDKGQDVLVRVYFREFGGLFLLGLPVSVYENSFNQNFRPQIKVLEKSDIELTATSTNANAPVNASQQYILVNN